MLSNYAEKCKLTNYINSKIKEKNTNSDNPGLNNVKYLLIVACHCNSEKKLNAIKNNLSYFNYDNIDKVFINTSRLKYGSRVERICVESGSLYYEVPNSGYCDFGKWCHVLKNLVDYKSYDYIVLTNDSYIIHSSINHYLNLIPKYNVDLYGYNDSSETNYHYQSYLFTIKQTEENVDTFINKVMGPGLKIKKLQDVIDNFELKMVEWFQNTESFLKIGHFKQNENKNILMSNDNLYIPLRNSGLLPFTKIKRL